MAEPKRTPGQAEGTEEDAQNALNKGASSSSGKTEKLDKEPGRTPGQAEGTKEQAKGSLKNQ